MSIIRKAVVALVVLSVLAFRCVSHAETLEDKQVGQPNLVGAITMQTRDRMESLVTTITQPVINIKELQCLARNIFFEAAGEPEEGKVAVGLVTLNRVQDGRFAQSVCGVVDQKLVKSVPKEIVVEKRTLFRTERETQTVWSKLTICQFSWRCMNVKNPKSQDERWIESQQIAHDLLSGEHTYAEFRSKYDGALYFHATYVKPTWARQKQTVAQVGGHRFYRER